MCCRDTSRICSIRRERVETEPSGAQGVASARLRGEAMTTAPVSAASPRPVERLWNRSLDRYPSNPTRYLSLGIVVATTIVLYYQLYLSGGVATSILRNLHMSFTYYVN